MFLVKNLKNYKNIFIRCLEMIPGNYCVIYIILKNCPDNISLGGRCMSSIVPPCGQYTRSNTLYTDPTVALCEI